MRAHPTRTAAFVSLWAFLLALLPACGQAPGQTETLRYGLTLVPTGIDPHLNASAELGIPLSSVYDTLVFQDPGTGAFVPGLAERWTISDDGLSYTFELRRDVTFHDGSRFDAAAVRANLEYVLDPDNHSQKAAFMLGSLESVEPIDEYTVQLRLREPYAPLLDSLSQVYLGMASPAALQEWGSSEYQFHQVGTGPYRFVEYVPNDYLTLERNPDYAWGPSIYASDRASIQRVVFTFYEDRATRAIALESGEADVIGEIQPRDAARLEQGGGFVTYPVHIPGQPLQYLFNTQRAPTDDLRVRQALTQAVDRPEIVETVFGAYSPVAEGPLSTVTLGFDPGTPYPPYDLPAAVARLEEAGWVDTDGDGTRERGGQPLSLHIIAPNWGSNPEVAQLLQAAWQALGASVTVEVAAGFGALKESQAAGEYNLIGVNFFGTDPDLLRSTLSSDGLYAWTGYRDSRLDETLLEASGTTLDPVHRSALYAEVARITRDQALLLPIRDYVNLVVANTRVQGLRFSSQGWFPLLVDLRLAP